MAALVLARSLPFLGPVADEGLYNSDSAIPVLMSNLAGLAPVDWLFWGQDRFGSWPFLIARAAGGLTGHAWTPHGLHVLRTLWMTAALIPWVALAGEAGLVAGAGLLLLPGLSPLLERILVDGGTVDGWQLPALLWAWWGLRRMAVSARPQGWLLLATVASILATWSSLVSAPVLAALALVEGTQAGVGRGRRALLAAPVLAGTLFESGVRAAWHAAVRARGWPDVRTLAQLDNGHLGENLVGMAAVAWQAQAVPWIAAALAAAIVTLGVGRARGEPPATRTVVGAAAAALVSLAVVVAVHHVRLNAYNPRYLGLGLSFCVLGVSAVVGLALRAVLHRWSGAFPAVAVVAVGSVLMLAPRARPDPRQEVLLPAAQEIQARFPAAVLAASYWRTYSLAALLPPGSVTPVPREGEWNRRPDWAASLGSGRPVLVGRRSDAAGAPAILLERGARLGLVEPDVLFIPPFPAESTGELLSLYRATPERAEVMAPRQRRLGLIEAHPRCAFSLPSVP